MFFRAIVPTAQHQRYLGPQSTSDSEGWLTTALGSGRRSSSGVQVTNEAAMHYSAVYACIKILSETLAMTPLHVFEEKKSGTKERTKSHPLASILHGSVNEEQVSYSWKETGQHHIAAWGNGYSEIQRNGKGDVVGLWTILPDRTHPHRKNGRIKYSTFIDGEPEELDISEVLHVPGLGFDGLCGFSPIYMARQAIGLGIATETFGAKWFERGTYGGLILEHPSELSNDAYERLKNTFNSKYAGPDNHHSTKILEEGMKVRTLPLPPNDAQFLETRKLQVAEISRYYTVPLHKLSEMERVNYNTVEQLAKEFIEGTMLPIFTRWENIINQRLFRKSEIGRFYVKFNAASVLRGDSIARSEFYQKAVGVPWMKPNEARALEDLNPVEGGDTVAAPLNMTLDLSKLDEQNKKDLSTLLLAAQRNPLKEISANE
jgi:HK97 family phage portal protein